MKCPACGAWSEVRETRQADRGYTLKRTRDCADGHRFVTFEVLTPVYRNDPSRVRSAVQAAEARAIRAARNAAVLRDVKTMTRAEVAARHGLTLSLVKFLVERKSKTPNFPTRTPPCPA